MKYEKWSTDEGVAVATATFEGAGRREVHVVVAPEGIKKGFAEQLAAAEKTLSEFQAKLSADGLVEAAKRVFVDDPMNNASALHEVDSFAAVVGQTPYGSRISVLAQFVEAESPKRFVTVRGPYREHRHLFSPLDVSEGEAPVRAMSEYVDLLASHGLTLEANCLRTWFFVRDIDRNYHYVVRGRNMIFSSERLNPRTHFIASTGIGCETDTPKMPLLFETLTVEGLKPEQVRYIKAPEMLNDTIEYGVAFERATAVEYGDRQVVYVSGTASIDNRGEIVGEGDVTAQTARMCSNIRALLEAAGSAPADIAHAVLYCRNLADAEAILASLPDDMRAMPMAVVKAPVCRPGWLVEMECMAITPCSNDAFAPY